MVEERVPAQTISESVNKTLIIGFKVGTVDSSSVYVVSEMDIAERGGAAVRDIHLKCTEADGYLGLGVEPEVLEIGDVKNNIMPVFRNAFLDKENLGAAYIKVIRAGDVNLVLEGFVVVN